MAINHLFYSLPPILPFLPLHSPLPRSCPSIRNRLQVQLFRSARRTERKEAKRAAMDVASIVPPTVATDIR